MNRRSFLRSASAVGIAPMLPAFPGFMAPAAAATVNEFTYGMAVFRARMHGSITAEMIRKKSLVSLDAAQSIHGRMVKDGFVGLPDPTGLSVATNPTLRPTQNIPATAMRLKKRAEAHIRKITEDFAETDDTVEPQTDQIDSSDTDL